MKDAGAEGRIWGTQFGLKSRHGTTDAIFLARRRLEETWSSAEGQLVLLALDWAKAFDSVMPGPLLKALQRFGVPGKMLTMIQAIYTGRNFAVREAGVTSGTREQRAGICQGCPLPPFLFAMVMTVLLRDARVTLGDRMGDTEELVYADDTLIVATSTERAQEYMTAIAAAGTNYGLKFNWGKLELLTIRCQGSVASPDGAQIPKKGLHGFFGECFGGRWINRFRAEQATWLRQG